MIGTQKAQAEQHIRNKGKSVFSNLKSDVLFIMLVRSFGFQCIRVICIGSEAGKNT